MLLLLPTAVSPWLGQSTSGGAATRYVLHVLYMTLLRIMDHMDGGMPTIPLQRVTSLRRRVQANAADASYWLCSVVDDIRYHFASRASCLGGLSMQNLPFLQILHTAAFPFLLQD